MLEYTIIVALLASFIMLILDKWNYFEKFRVWTGWEPCFFCHCFWICALIVMVTVIFRSRQLEMIIIPFIATPITWYISVR